MGGCGVDELPSFVHRPGFLLFGFFFLIPGFGSVNLCPPSLHISEGGDGGWRAEKARQTVRQMGLKERNK